MDRQSKFKRIGSVVLICAAAMLFSSGYLYLVRTCCSGGELYSVGRGFGISAALIHAEYDDGLVPCAPAPAFCVYLLRDFSWKLRYLLPNLLFALMHIFAYHDFEPLNLEYVVSFLLSNLPGLLMMGCVFQLLKEKSGTLWGPILVHTICDFTGTLMD